MWTPKMHISPTQNPEMDAALRLYRRIGTPDPSDEAAGIRIVKYKEVAKLCQDNPAFKKGMETLDKYYHEHYGRPTMYTQVKQKEAMHTKMGRMLDNIEAATDRLRKAKQVHAAADEAQRKEQIKAIENG